MDDDRVKNALKSLVGKKHVYLFSSGNEALKQFGNLFKYKNFLVQDQCSLPVYNCLDTYSEVKTNYGLIEVKDLILKCQNNILLISGSAGLFAEQPIDKFIDICKEKNCFILNDVSGSIGLSSAMLGDYAIGYFDLDLLINLGYGGFVASNSELKLTENFDKNKFLDLYEKLIDMDERLKHLYWINEKIKKDFLSFNVVHRESKGINVLFKFDSELEKNKIIKYCDKNQLSYALKPKNLKNNENLILIEVNKK